VGGTLKQPKWNLTLGTAEVTTQSFRDIVKEMGKGDSKCVDILKLDIEGSENFAVPYLLQEPEFDSLCVSVILLECHLGLLGGSRDIILSFVNVLEQKGYFMYSIEHNYFWTAGAELAFIHYSKL